MTTSHSEPAERSALEENISRKGKNAYYFAHAHKATGPQWDGKVEPRLLSRNQVDTSTSTLRSNTNSSFEYTKSNITTYSFLDEEMKVKLYIDLEGVGQKCSDEDISLAFDETSMRLVVSNYRGESQCLSFSKLAAPISNASWKKKPNKLIITLNKRESGEWHTINDKGTPDHEVV